MTYGNGDDKNRDEYANSCDIKTSSVDATPFRPDFGFDNWIREIFWGFDASNYPINGRVWYPEGQGPFPLVIFVHGNHLMQEYSDPGYEYIATLLASKGYIAASIDENFLNSNWSGDYSHNEIFTRAWLILKHLECWREWNQQEDNPFYQTVDMDNIALVGHSRGRASRSSSDRDQQAKRYYKDANQDFNFNFSIKGIVEIAPTAFYSMHKDKPLELENIDYLLLQEGMIKMCFPWQEAENITTFTSRIRISISSPYYISMRPIMDNSTPHGGGKICPSLIRHSSI